MQETQNGPQYQSLYLEPIDKMNAQDQMVESVVSIVGPSG